MSRNTHHKLSTILQQLRASGTLYGRSNPQPPSSRQQSLSRPTPPSSPAHQAQASTFRGHFDQGHAVSLSLPEAEHSYTETENIASGFSLSEDFDMDFGTPEIIGVGHGFSNAASMHMGGDSHHGVRQGGQNGSGGALQQDNRFGNRFQQQPQHHLELEDAPMDDMDEEDFDEDLDAILNSQPQHRQGASRQFSEEVVPPAPKTFEQPKAHTLFDKMAQGMEYATTFDVGSVNLSSVFDQFDTAMEVKEMTKAPLKTKHDSQDMAEMFSQFDRQMSVEKTPADLVSKIPEWRPSRPTITHFEDWVKAMGPSLYLLEKCPGFKDEILLPFDTGAYKDIQLDFSAYNNRDERAPAGFGKIQVRLDGVWTDLRTEDIDLSNRNINWDTDLRIQIGVNTHISGRYLGVGDRMNTILHEWGLHGLSCAELIRGFRRGNRSAEDLRLEYVKRVALETDHLSIEGTHFPKNQLYASLNNRVLQWLKTNKEWKEFGVIAPEIYTNYPEIDRAIRDIKHDQSSKPPQVPIWFQFLVVTVMERDTVYRASNPQSAYSVRYHEVKPEEVDRLYRSATEAEIRQWFKRLASKPTLAD